MPRTGLQFDSQKLSALVLEVIEENLPRRGPGVEFRRELNQIYAQKVQDCPDSLGIGLLPGLACAAVGGDPAAAEPLIAGWQLVRLAAKLLDDVEDLDVETNTSIAINSATGLLSAAPLVVHTRSTLLDRDVVWQVNLELQRAILRAAAGQHTDLTREKPDKPMKDSNAWLDIAIAKSGELLGWAAWAGALAGGADEQIQARMRDYGIHLGVLLQVADDLHGVWGAGGAADLVGHQLNLAVCYARSVLNGPQRIRLETLLSATARKEQAAEREALSMLTTIGAQAFLLATARLQHGQAWAALERAVACGHQREPLLTLLDRVMPIVGTSSG